jgi:two-component system, cell cycle response regulator DivK
VSSSVDVLLIEVNELDGKLFKLLLEGHLGLSIHHSKDAEDALLWLKGNRPRLIHSDVMMSDPSGWEVVKRLKQRPDTREIPIVVVTAGAFVANETSEIVQLVEAQLPKPITAHDYCIAPILQQRT